MDHKTTRDTVPLNSRAQTEKISIQENDLKDPLNNRAYSLLFKITELITTEFKAVFMVAINLMGKDTINCLVLESVMIIEAKDVKQSHDDNFI